MYPTEDLKSIQGTGLLKKVCDMKQSSSRYRRLYRLKVKNFLSRREGVKVKVFRNAGLRSFNTWEKAEYRYIHTFGKCCVQTSCNFSNPFRI